ncbi:nucleotidyltransferase domain-containing protein [Dickeya poaceiphila]|uniref:Nucleotidyltransferase domain-containing protein n=1 Tax=Dickeya poaceiphila TaxID=568768 RepID=A0A5B8IB56_9GAMM|nr:nucleotidyltransferase domain-containing protein [Dickeya poaceiphila]QDX31421.1 nucleotidyltransferase domain-containing protein [Dickeya poaceiphila]
MAHADIPGRFFPLDEQGFIVNDTSAHHFPAAFGARLVSAFQQWFPKTLRAVYLRGSVARGTQVPYLSDLDAFAVVADGCPTTPLTADDALTVELHQLLPGLTELEFTTCQEKDVLGNYLGVWPFFIKTQSLLLYGHDYARQLAPYRPGVAIMGEALWLSQRMAEYQRRLRQPEWQAKPRLMCEWIMKAVVRAAFELTMEQQRCYTRDLSLCCQVFCRQYPQQADLCRQAVAWAIEPDDCLAEQQQLLAAFCPWIEQQLQVLLAQHQVDPADYQLAPAVEEG